MILHTMSIRRRIVLAVLLPVLFLAGTGTALLLENLERYETTRRMKSSAALFRATSEMVTELQRERGKTAVFVTGKIALDELKAQRQETDQKRARLHDLVAGDTPASQLLNDLTEWERDLSGLRAQFGNPAADPAVVIRRYRELIGRVMEVLIAIADVPSTGDLGKTFSSLVLVEDGKENAGLLRATVSSLLGADQALSQDELQILQRFKIGVDASLNSPALFLSEASHARLRELKTKPQWKEVERILQIVVSHFREGGYKVPPAEFFTACTAVIGDLDTIIQDEIRQTVQEADRVNRTAAWKMGLTVGGVLLVLLLCGLLSLGITLSITRPLNRVILALSSGADQVNDAAAQVSSASQDLAAGASAQASSLEETSSALEQMAAMTRTNAENSKEANGLAGQARQAAHDGDRSMIQLNEAMAGINESSGKISKIIKVIEEIAFQTNLLALNAAVEAARAGEHGKGFAVVADEVRNLAQRCAQAAKETTGLIEDAVSRSRQGGQVAADVGKSLAAIVGDVSKVSDLVGGISKASEEQAQGVDQVNTAVSQMDKVTQANAAGAEETASAAEQLSSQAQTVKSMVNELVAIVRGSSAATQAAVAAKDSAIKVHGSHFYSRKAYLKDESQPQPESVTVNAAGRPDLRRACSDDGFLGMSGDQAGLRDF